jgi:hypothetical protein
VNSVAKPSDQRPASNGGDSIAATGDRSSAPDASSSHSSSSRSTLRTQEACSGHSTDSGWLVIARRSVTRAGRSGAAPNSSRPALWSARFAHKGQNFSPAIAHVRSQRAVLPYVRGRFSKSNCR